MSLIPREKIDDVRERTNIVEVVKRHVELKRAGTASWKGLCPFHAEKTPSFHVHESRQFFHCFGCGEKGDAFSFLTKIEQRSFMEVLRDLAQQAGVDLPEKPMSPAERQALAEAESDKERMLRAMEITVAFFQAQLATPAGERARRYVSGRGLSADTLAKFQVGYAPDSWDALQRHLASKGVQPDVAERLGLVGANDRGRYDFFRDRVMLPVLDRTKRPVGFSSRLLDPDAKDRKYVNSPDSPLFHKKQQLYGLHAALDPIRKSGTAVIVEGNFDVMALHEAGIDEAVAPMGTALTPEQIAIVSRIAQKVVVIFDGDEAGQRAARKVIPLFVEANVDGRIARMPPRMDPDDFVKKEGAEAFRKLVASARPMVEQFVDEVVLGAEDSVPGRVAALEQAAAVLSKVQNPTARELYAARLANALGLAPQQVLRALRGATASPAKRPAPAGESPPAAAPGDAPRTPPRDELELLVVLVASPALARTPEAQRAADLLVDPSLRRLCRQLAEAVDAAGRLNVTAWLDAGPQDVRQAVTTAIMDGRYDGLEGIERVLRSLLARLERARIDAEIEEMKRQHKDALARGDVEAARAISLREIELIRTKQGLSQSPMSRS